MLKLSESKKGQRDTHSVVKLFEKRYLQNAMQTIHQLYENDVADIQDGGKCNAERILWLWLICGLQDGAAAQTFLVHAQNDDQIQSHFKSATLPPGYT